MKSPAEPGFNSRRDFLKASVAMAGLLWLDGWAEAQTAGPWPAGTLPRTIHPYPNQVSWGSDTLRLEKKARLGVPFDADASVLQLMTETWQRFTFGAIKLFVTKTSSLPQHTFVLYDAGRSGEQDELRKLRPPVITPDSQATYALNVDGRGILAAAIDSHGVRQAWFTLLQLLDAREMSSRRTAFMVPHVKIQDWPAVAFRGLHLCVFRETTPLMIEKAVRLAAFYKFTHVVLEFWGMLKLDSLKELSWPEAWSKRQARRLVASARGMGLEVIPMFNCWGHATACRVKYGRHVVLDQNPALAPLFEPDGWTWCLTNPRVQTLLRSVGDELIEFAGPGQYFHIGCDEAYSHATCDRCRQADRVQLFADHINNLAAYLDQRGRRPIMWGDALLESGKWPAGFTANGTTALPTHQALDKLSRKIVIADWHYDVTKGAVPTLGHFKARGFDTLACPWNIPGNIRTLAKAAAANHSGVLMTTWHHLAQSIPNLAYVANCAWSEDQAALGLRQMDWPLLRTSTAAHLRKLVPANGRFEDAGWNPSEMPQEVD